MTNLRKSQLILASLLTACTIVLLPTKAKADEIQVLKSQVQALQQKVNVLQNQLVNQNIQPVFQPAGATIYDQWDPFQQMGMMESQMNRFMKNNTIDFNPKEDIKQTPGAYIITMDIPGTQKDKINIEVKNGMLIVSGDRNSELKKNMPNQYYLQEQTYGQFLRTMLLPQDVKAGSIEAKYRNGVLTVKILRNKALNHREEVQKIEVK